MSASHRRPSLPVGNGACGGQERAVPAPEVRESTLQEMAPGLTQMPAGSGLATGKSGENILDKAEKSKGLKSFLLEPECESNG